MTGTRRRGFTLLEMLIVAVMACVLVAIALPRFFQAQKRAKKSEAITQLKTLHAAMSTQVAKPASIHVPGFNPARGNHYSYHLEDSCSSFEYRGSEFVIWNDFDTCIGVDTFANLGYPDYFYPVPIAAVAWDDNGTMNGMSTSAGIYGSETNWDYLAYAAGNRDEDVFDSPDTWSVASADAQITPTCPAAGAPELLPAGEPFQVFDDRDKDCN
jgi:type IV pilus assembly protein PilA